MLRRLLPIVAIVSVFSAICPAPAVAMTTEQEIQLGRENDQQIVESTVIETDPLLNEYIQNISDQLWRQVARKDVPYNIKIIKGNDINAFSTLGGYVYIYEGLIDFAQSDDEMAGIIGHETGHIERRHAVTLQSKAQALNLLFGIASLFSPLIYNFGNLLEAGAIAKMERTDELQADRYGLQLMSRAGYDPDAMVTMMQHLNVLESQHVDAVTKYLQDHPNPGPRVSHLMGYPELDPKVVTANQMLVQAASDEERARYSYANVKLQQVLQKDPDNAAALLDLAQAQLALGLTSKSEQTLEAAAAHGSPQAKAQSDQRIAALRSMQAHRINFTRPNLEKLKALMTQANTLQDQASVQIQARRDQGRDQYKALATRLEALQPEYPDFSRVNVRPGMRAEALERNLAAMARSLNSGMEDAQSSLAGLGTLEKNKESGLLKDSQDILHEMNAPLGLAQIPADSLGILPSYPSMFSELSRADGDMLRAADASRASLTLMDQTVGDLDAFFKQANYATQRLDFHGDIPQQDYTALVPQMQKVTTELNQAATAASQAAQLYNMARTRQLSTRLTLLGLANSPERYATLQASLQHRYGLNGIDYTAMLRDGFTPGDVTVATILAADIKSTPQSLLEEAKASHQSIVNVADAHGMHAWPLEIFTGLTYLDFTDDPQKEMHGQ